MAAQQTRLLSVGLTQNRWNLLQPILVAALKNLDIAETFAAVCLAADDLPSDDEAWYRLEPGDSRDRRSTLIISCHPKVFWAHQPLTAQSSPEIWEVSSRPIAEQEDDKSTFSRSRSEAFLHHHLWTVQDIMTGQVIAEMVPRTLTEAFAALWAVVVDGRLARHHLPGYELAERRGQFSRLFSTAGILLPGHWQLFQALWDGSITDQKQVLAAVRQLPRL